MPDKKNTSKNKKEKVKTKKTKNIKESPWENFWSTTIYTIVFFWILFPFYSYQLQVILDQRQCKGKTPNDKNQGNGNNCMLPHNIRQTPYYPCKNGKIPENAIEGKECPEEHVKGPDMFSFMLHFARSVFRDGYNILVGEAWIEADKLSEELEKEIKNDTGMSGEAKNNSSTNKKNSVKKQKGGAKIKIHGDTVNSVSASRMEDYDKSKIINDSHSARKYRKENSKSTGTDIALSAMEKTFGFSASSMKKNKIRSLCCKDLKKYGLAKDQVIGCSAKKKTIFDHAPFNFMSPSKFGWPYNYIFDDPTSEKTTAYNPNGTEEEASPARWLGAWFAKTQQRSWSSSRSIWSNILSFFLPYLHEDLPPSVVGDRIDDFIGALNDEINAINQKDPEKPNKPLTMRQQQQINKLSEIKTNFSDIKNYYDKAWQKDNVGKKRDKRTTRQLLYQVLEGNWGASKTTNYLESGKQESDNIYLDFFIASTKPESLRNWGGLSVFWNFLNGDYRYWFRYITTLYMPILSLLVLFAAIGTGLFTTPFSSLNRYSSFILPLFLGFGTTLYNMIAMPTEAFFYMIFGGSGKRDNSSKCPYEGGVYQMKRNMRAYWPINLFISLAIIVSSLGSALTADGNSWGVILTAFFPILILFRLTMYGGNWLWNLV